MVSQSRNPLYLNTTENYVAIGYGSGVVIATGEDTEFGVIFKMMQDVRLLSVFCGASTLFAKLRPVCRLKRNEPRCN